MPDDEDILLSFQLHDDRFKTNDNIPVRLSTSISVVELVFVPVCKIIRVRLLRGHQRLYTQTNTIVEGLPQFPTSGTHISNHPNKVRVDPPTS